MKKEVTITVSGDIGNETVTGYYMCDKGRHHLMYEQADKENAGCLVKTIMHFGDESIRLKRKTVREADEKLLADLTMEWPTAGEGGAVYQTPYGTMEFMVRVLSIHIPRIGESDIRAEVEYELHSKEEMLAAEEARKKGRVLKPEPVVKNSLKVTVKDKD